MIGIAFSFIAGIAAFDFFPFFPVSISALCFAVILFLLFKYNENKKKIFLIILVFASGLLYSSIRQVDLPELSLPDYDISITGTIIDVPEMSNEKIRFTLEQVHVEGEKIQGKVRLAVLQKLFNEKITKYKFAPGDRVSAIAKLGELHAFRNPGLYSYDHKKDGIVAVGYIKQMRLIRGGRGLLAWIYKRRQVLGHIMDSSLSDESASFHKAIIPGLKRGINQDMRDSFSSTGLAHLLSISGTHFGLLAFIIFRIIKTLVKYLPVNIITRMTLYITPTQIAILLTLPVLVLYALISGTSTPTIRSLIIVFIYMLALFLGRKDQWLNSLSIAAGIILLWQPGALFELSFQLSFLAVFSIGFVLEQRAQSLEHITGSIEHRQQNIYPSVSPLTKGTIGGIKRIFEKIKTAMIITAAAVLGTAPFVALYFKQFPLISPVTNLIITPFVCFVILPLGFFSGFIALLFNMSFLPLSGLTDAITHFALKIIRVFSNIPYSNFHIHNPSILMIVLYYSSLLFIIKSKSKWKFLPLGLVICIYLISPHLSDGDLKITFLDVGQGDSSLVELSDRKVMLIDSGTDDPDVGRRVIAPHLWSKGISSIDYIISSHPHPDHYGGLIYIMDNFNVGEIWLTGRVTYESKEFFQKIAEKKIPYKILSRGDIIEARRYKIYVFHPYDGFYAGSPRGEFSSQNSDSLVFKIESNDATILFTGDIEVEAEENLIYLGKWLRSDIIKVPHHGGRTSSSKEFLKYVMPQIAVVSAGKNNIFNHPHQETLERYENAGVRLLGTDTNGAITITARDKSYEIRTYGDSRFKKVAGWQDEIRNLKLLF